MAKSHKPAKSGVWGKVKGMNLICGDIHPLLYGVHKSNETKFQQISETNFNKIPVAVARF